MTKLLQEAVARVAALPDEEQDRAAEALIAFAADSRPYSFSALQIAGIAHALDQADHGEFATEHEMQGIFGRAL